MTTLNAGNRDGNPVTAICVRYGDHQRHLKGREAFALHALIQSGTRGITPIDNPAPRMSHYIFCLRREGFDIETIHEAHGGPFAGTHARYVLHTPVKLISATRKLDRVAQ